MTLPERPGLLHAVPILDLFALLWLMVQLGIPKYIHHQLYPNGSLGLMLDYLPMHIV